LSSLLVRNGKRETTELLKEAAASRYGITGLDASIEDLFGLKHRAKHGKCANLVHCHVMTRDETGAKLTLIAEDEEILRLPSEKGGGRPRNMLAGTE
jgi:hypothetical protein